MRKFSLLISLLLMTLGCIFAQYPELKILETGQDTNLRGLSSLDGQTIWVSGSGGLIGLSQDGGLSWKWQRPKGYENRDFRDIAALGDSKAIIIGIDTPAVILKTVDDAHNWQTVYTNNQPGMFLDAVDFADPDNGIVVGDPLHGHIFLARTTNGGDSWHTFIADLKDSIVSGEAFFAASGTNIHLKGNGDFVLPSGGARSRLWKNRHAAMQLPFQQGNPTAGPNGMDVKDNIIAIVGGDYTKPALGDSSLAISYDSGNSWQAFNKLPGYGSGVAVISDSVLIVCGLKGVWLTRTGGKKWITISQRPFNACRYIADTKKLYLAGPGGTIAVIKDL